MAKLICASTNENWGNWWAEDGNGQKSSTISTNNTWRALDVSKLSEPFTVYQDCGGRVESIRGVVNEDIVMTVGNPNAGNRKMSIVKPDNPRYLYAITD